MIAFLSPPSTKNNYACTPHKLISPKKCVGRDPRNNQAFNNPSKVCTEFPYCIKFVPYINGSAFAPGKVIELAVSKSRRKRLPNGT